MGKQQLFIGELDDFKGIYQYLAERGAVLLDAQRECINSTFDSLTDIPERVCATFSTIDKRDGLVEILSKSIDIGYHGAGIPPEFP